MEQPTKCYNCKKPVIPKGHLTYNQQRAYMLCPFCQSIIYLPVECNGGNSNPQLREWNVKSSSSSSRKK